ncbi:hypothetical protein SDC9_212795 [bioreactor metagenome]|uniref:Uncharacterized protein n=1 Tax=bioreactor metagenome TaxID=1076179 RepID=A0A645JNR7_9ZZZZ
MAYLARQANLADKRRIPRDRQIPKRRNDGHCQRHIRSIFLDLDTARYIHKDILVVKLQADLLFQYRTDHV